MSIVKNLFKSALFGILAIVAVAGLVSTPALAADNALLPNVCPQSGCLLQDQTAGKAGIAGFILNIASIFVYIIGAISVLFLVYGGFQYVTGGEAGAKSGRATITNAIIGLIVAVLAFTIVRLIGNFLSGQIG
jgi:Type IV secretion system pilin